MHEHLHLFAADGAFDACEGDGAIGLEGDLLFVSVGTFHGGFDLVGLVGHGVGEIVA